MDNTPLRVGIYGGSFAPPHLGHVAAAKAFMEKMWLDYLLVIPTCESPHKQMGKGDTPEDRLRMCELAFAGIDGIVVSDIEIRRGGKSYTVDTLRELTAPDRKLFLLCGTDMVLTFDRWYRYEEILKLAHPVYIRREEDDGITESAVVRKITEIHEKTGVMFTRVPTPAVPMCSTDVRDLIREKKDVSAYLPPAVAEYIREHRLYE